MITLVFDFGYTLVKKEIDRELIFQKVLRGFGKNIPLSVYNMAFRFADLKYVYNSVSTDNKYKTKYYNEYNSCILEFLGCKKDKNKYLGILKEEFNKKNNWVLFSDVLLAIMNLYQKYQLGILANWRSDLNNILRSNNNIDKYFDFVISSAEIGFEKPDCRIFNYCIDKYNLGKSDLIYIGDNYFLDIESTDKLNIKNILVDRNNYYKYCDCPKINSFKQLKNKIIEILK